GDFRDAVAATPAAALKRFDLLVVRDAQDPRPLARRLASRAPLPPTGGLRAGPVWPARLGLPAGPGGWSGPPLHRLGERDALVPGVAEALREQWPGARVELLDSASHALPLSHAETIAALIHTYMKEVQR